MVPDYELPKGRGIGPDPEEIEKMREELVRQQRRQQVLLFTAGRVFARMAGELIYTEAVQDLIVKTASGYVPGSQEFYRAFRMDRPRHPDGDIPRGFVVPMRPVLMSQQEERALYRKYLFDKYEPLDLYKFVGINEYYRHRADLAVSERYIDLGFPTKLPPGWEERIKWLLSVLWEHTMGYKNDVDDNDSLTYLTAIIAHRNASWGIHNGTGKEPGMALFKYAIFMYRKILYTTPAEDSDADAAAEAFEELLNLITIPNKRMAVDHMRHVPHKVIYE